MHVGVDDRDAGKGEAGHGASVGDQGRDRRRLRARTPGRNVTPARLPAHAATPPARERSHETRADRTDPTKPRAEPAQRANRVPGTRFAPEGPQQWWPADGGRFIAGFRSKKPHGCSSSPTYSHGITGKSSGRATCVVPNVAQTTTSRPSSGGPARRTAAGRRRRGAGSGSRRPPCARRVVRRHPQVVPRELARGGDRRARRRQQRRGAVRRASAGSRSARRARCASTPSRHPPVAGAWRIGVGDASDSRAQRRLAGHERAAEAGCPARPAAPRSRSDDRVVGAVDVEVEAHAEQVLVVRRGQLPADPAAVRHVGALRDRAVLRMPVSFISSWIVPSRYRYQKMPYS